MTIGRSGGPNSIKDPATNSKANVGTKKDGSTQGLHVLAEIDGEVSTISGANFKIEQSFSQTALQQSFQDFLAVDPGSGFLYGFKFDFSNDVLDVRVILDGITSFTVNLDDLRGLNYAGYNNSGIPRFFGTAQFGELEFFPNFPLRYDSELRIQVQKTVSWNVNADRYQIFYTEE